MKKKLSHISLYEMLHKCWDNLLPIKIKLNGKTIWDDHTCEMTLCEVENCLLNDEANKSIMIKEVRIKIVDFHHSIINIKTV